MTPNPEKRHNQSTPFLQAVFDTIADGVITINNRGVLKYINPAAAKLFGYDPSEVIGQNVKILMPSPYHEEHDGYLDNYHSSGKKKIIGIGREVQGKKQDGTVFPLYLRVSEFQYEGHQMFAGIIRDMSEIRFVEEQLLQSQSILRSVFETAVDGVIIIDDKGTIHMANAAVSKLFGFNQKELLGHNIKMLMPQPHKKQHDGYLSNYKRTRKAKIIGIGREVEGQKKNGGLFPFRLSISELKLENEKYYSGIIHDLTEQKKAEGEILQLNAQLEKKVEERTEELSKAVNKLLSTNNQLSFEINQRKKVEEALRQTEIEIRASLEKEKELNDLKSRFVSMASHEFRTPLSTIKSSAALIGRYTEGEQQEKREKHINRIKSAVNNLTGILNDFLSLGKLEEGKIENKPEHFKLSEICAEAIDEVQGMLKEGQTIHHEKHEEAVELFLDIRLLKNSLLNLLSNAIKYSGPNKDIHLLENVNYNELIITVKDEGIGIPKKDQVHMFSRFFRAGNATNIQGTGLGLNIVTSYVDMMGGKISFESVEGTGTSFFITLPLKR